MTKVIYIYEWHWRKMKVVQVGDDTTLDDLKLISKKKLALKGKLDSNTDFGK